jgi:putative DNA primase/helicase
MTEGEGWAEGDEWMGDEDGPVDDPRALRISGVVPDGRVELWVQPGDMSGTADRAMHVLATHDHGGRVYRRGTSLVMASAASGELGVTEMTEASLDYELGRCVIAKTRLASGKEKSGPLPRAILSQLLSGACQNVTEIRPLAGVLSTPFLAPDGAVVRSPGYHAGSGYLLAGDVPAVRVAEEPTRELAARALAALVDVFVDFPYPADEDRHVPIAALLTILAAPAIRGNLPAFLFDATTAGSGKTLQQEVVAVLASGRVPHKMAWVRDEDERRKTIMAAALDGGPVMLVDNVSRDIPFGGADIDMLLTSGGRLAFRGLGGHDLLKVDWRPVIIASGNNIGIAGDTNRRVIRARLQTDEEDPEQRTAYVHPERANRLVEWVLERRGKLLSAALTVLRAYVAAGRPEPLRMGSFAEWAALVPSAIVYAGGPNVLECVPRADDVSSTTDVELRALLASWPALSRFMPGAEWETRDLIGVVWRTERENDDFADFRDSVTDALRTRPGYDPSVRALANMLGRMRGRVMYGRRLCARRSTSRNVTVWSVETVAK